MNNKVHETMFFKTLGIRQQDPVIPETWKTNNVNRMIVPT